MPASCRLQATQLHCLCQLSEHPNDLLRHSCSDPDRQLTRLDEVPAVRPRLRIVAPYRSYCSQLKETRAFSCGCLDQCGCFHHLFVTGTIPENARPTRACIKRT